ncbi:MAG: exodeoxyribonuclease VII small subunit [Actinomycetia bacterium]|nr:exodeoxyribonuclease VII small subunit [Actinomycetes bacterium]MCP4227380.1 exodeoxyribonuclease VII small subunit [Actinomycetes bacterium]MCP5030325.1 exodeoxyribonuclease VII small subunit [Actinomycetes bacterium]
MTERSEQHDGELDLSYTDALEELDDILAQLESSTVDVDVLADRVARGAVLVRYCRQRLRVVRTDVEAVVDDLLDDDAAGGKGANSTNAGR